MPTGDPHGLGPMRGWCTAACGHGTVGPQLLGRIIDGAAQPSMAWPLNCEDTVRLTGVPMNPLGRQPISQALDVGVRTINSLLTVGRAAHRPVRRSGGQERAAGHDVRYTSADVIVVGLIGERGRK